jgi:hypothetical protein
MLGSFWTGMCNIMTMQINLIFGSESLNRNEFEIHQPISMFSYLFT